MTMINPTKRQKKIADIYEKEVIPWVYVDKETGADLLRTDAPEDIKKKYELYMKS